MTVWKGNRYKAGLDYGSHFVVSDVVNGMLSDEKRAFTQNCIPLYQKYYPEILEEIKGVAKGISTDWENVAAFLFCMYCFDVQNRCSSFAFCNNDKIILGKNSDFLTFVENVWDSVYYDIEGSYRFIGNTTAWTEIEDGMNECGLAVALTFVYPTKIGYGLNGGMILRYILEKCQNTQQAIQAIQKLPIASAQTITIADKTGKIVVVECNCEKVTVIKPSDNKNAVFATNHFVSREMCVYQYKGQDDCYSHKRLQTLQKAFEYQKEYTVSFAMDLLSGKKGFLCQYDRKEDIDTIWSVIYDLTENKVYMTKGNPSQKDFTVIPIALDSGQFINIINGK